MRVLLADNRAKVRSALQLVLEQEADTEIVGEASSSGALYLLVEERSPDVLLLDWDLPGSPVAAILPTLRHLRPELQVIVLSASPEVRRAAQELGVEAFVSKNAPAEELLAAVNSLRDGLSVPNYLLDERQAGASSIDEQGGQI